LGRSWQFFLTIAIVIAAMTYFYYSSDFYAKRAAGLPPATPAPSQGAIIPSNE
jgi:hypothetical protein